VGTARTQPDEIAVFITQAEATCADCGDKLGRHAWIALDKDRDSDALCLSCADLDQLVFLPSGDPALTRRAKKHSVLKAAVLKWSRARKRYERQGMLVEEAALAQAEQECLADADARERRREREAERRAEEDQEFVARFALAVREEYPSLPAGRERAIAEHACLKYSGRVGRSAAAKRLDLEAVRLAVAAHVRHVETDYDESLAQGYGRGAARIAVERQVARVLARWSGAHEE
jgi:hypothetical protein